MIIQALRDERIIISRNQHLPLSKGIKIILIGAEKIKEQVAEALKKLNLQAQEGAMFSRCILCNVELKDIAKDKVKEKVPEYVYQTQKDFITCPKCKRIYWPGTHWGNVEKILTEIK